MFQEGAMGSTKLARLYAGPVRVVSRRVGLCLLFAHAEVNTQPIVPIIASDSPFPFEIRLVPMTVIADSMYGDGDRLALTVDWKGRYYVSAGRSGSAFMGRVFVFDSGGRSIGHFGREGKGPGEYL